MHRLLIPYLNKFRTLFKLEKKIATLTYLKRISKESKFIYSINNLKILK